MNFNSVKIRNIQILFFAIFVVIVSFITLYQYYEKPAALFWDENYHIASAEKYLQNRMFMECHPPLGKLLIAAGEALLEPNKHIDKTTMVESDYLLSIPEGLSFKGYRFFPVVLSMLGALLLYFIILLICKNPFWSFTGTLLYLLDNAVIVHFRSAMLDGIQLFFVFCVVLTFLWSTRDGSRPRWYHYSCMAFFAGLTVSIKLNGAVIMPLFVFLFIYEYAFDLQTAWKLLHTDHLYKKAGRQCMSLLQKASIRMAQSIPVFFGVLTIVFMIHTSLGEKPLQFSTYKASEEYLQILKENRSRDLRAFPIMLRDNIKYMSEYQTGVPSLNLSNPGENGSYPLGWPFGNKAINYRWERNGDSVRYLYLQGNPLIWILSLAGIVLSLVLVLARYIFKAPVENKRLFNLAQVFLFLYIFYMFSMLRIDRVMYLYHYILPLQFANILLCITFTYLYHNISGKKKILIHAAVFLILISVCKVFLFFSPLTYYQPLSKEEIASRSWSPWWRLEHVE